MKKARPAFSEAAPGADGSRTTEVPDAHLATFPHDSNAAQLQVYKAKRRELRGDAFPARLSSWCGLCFGVVRWGRLIASAPPGSNPRRRWCHFDCVVRWHVAPHALPEWIP